LCSDIHDRSFLSPAGMPHRLITPFRRNRANPEAAPITAVVRDPAFALIFCRPLRGDPVCSYIAGHVIMSIMKWIFYDKTTSTRPACGAEGTGLDVRVGPPDTGPKFLCQSAADRVLRAANSAAGRHDSIRFIVLIYNIFPTLGGHFAGTQTRIFRCRQGKIRAMR
jgi:hypothetical protein